MDRAGQLFEAALVAHAEVREIAKAQKITKEQALAKMLEEDPSLYSQYLQERKAKIDRLQ